VRVVAASRPAAQRVPAAALVFGPVAFRVMAAGAVAKQRRWEAAVTYLRGRSITNELVIVDEAQNLELPTLKEILTRMAANSKVVFCGDLTQVDNPYVSPFGGLAALIEKFKGNPMFGHITMERTVRSPLAELATQLL
jgi:predicted ribonuclease YlaK